MQRVLAGLNAFMRHRCRLPARTNPVLGSFDPPSQKCPSRLLPLTLHPFPSSPPDVNRAQVETCLLSSARQSEEKLWVARAAEHPSRKASLTSLFFEYHKRLDGAGLVETKRILQEIGTTLVDTERSEVLKRIVLACSQKPTGLFQLVRILTAGKDVSAFSPSVYLEALFVLLKREPLDRALIKKVIVLAESRSCGGQFGAVASLLLHLVREGRGSSAAELMEPLQKVFGRDTAKVLLNAVQLVRVSGADLEVRLNLLAVVLTAAAADDANFVKELQTAAGLDEAHCERSLYLLVKRYCNTGCGDQAVLLLKGLLKAGSIIKIGTFVPILVHACRRRSPDLIKAVHDLVVAAQLSWSKAMRVAVRVLACQLGEQETAMRLPGLIHAAGLHADATVYNTLMAAHKRTGDLKRAEECYQAMQEAGVQADVWTWNQQLASLCNVGEVEKAADLLLEMREAGVGLDACSYTTVMAGWARRGAFEEAAELFRVLQQDGLLPTLKTWNVVMNVLCQSGQMEEAEALLRWLKKEGVEPNVVTYSTLIKGWGKAEEVTEAERVFKEMLVAGIAPNKVTMQALLLAYCQSGDVSHGEALLKDMRARGWPVDAQMYTTLITWWGREGRVAEACRVFKEMQAAKCPYDVVTCNALVMAYCRAGLLEEAEQLLPQMRAAGVVPNKVTYNTLIAFWNREGRDDRSMLVLDQLRSRGCPSVDSGYLS